MFKKSIAPILLFLMFDSCDTSAVGPSEGLPVEVDGQFAFMQTDYYSYQVSSGAELRSTSRITLVEVGTATETSFVVAASVSPSNVRSGTWYLVTFAVTGQFQDSTALFEKIKVRLVSENGSSDSTDITLSTFMYPYYTTEIVLNAYNVPSFPIFQDVTFLNDTMFFRPTGSKGLHKVDPVTMSTTELFLYPGGDHLAADSGVVFIDDHSVIDRWNTATSVLERNIVRYDFNSSTSIEGMDVLDGRLVVVGWSPSAGQFRCRYDYRGALIDSVSFITNGYYLAIHNGILHRIGTYVTPQIVRYTFAGAALPSLMPPARRLFGIKFHGDHLYFCDYQKRMIGRVPVADLKEMP